jgi:hypothetical protein
MKKEGRVTIRDDLALETIIFWQARPGPLLMLTRSKHHVQVRNARHLPLSALEANGIYIPRTPIHAAAPPNQSD